MTKGTKNQVEGMDDLARVNLGENLEEEFRRAKNEIIPEIRKLMGEASVKINEAEMLAEKYGIKNPPSPSSGCALTSRAFGEKVKDVFEHSPQYQRWEFEILKLGRHFRLSDEVKVIVARDAIQNESLTVLHPQGTSLLCPKSFVGPNARFLRNCEGKPLRRLTRRAHSCIWRPLSPMHS